MKPVMGYDSRNDNGMALSALEPGSIESNRSEATKPRRKRGLTAQIRAALPFTGQLREEAHGHHDAELFYFQKQIQMQTPMVIVLEDGQQLHGVIEWYDRNSIKVRGRQRHLIYKSAIKYIYKHGEISAAGCY